MPQQHKPVEVPDPPSGASANTPWAEDEQSRNEEKYWDNPEKLQGLKRRNHAWVLATYGVIVPVFMGFFAFVFAASLGVWVWHHVTAWGFLEQAQLDKIQSVVFSGTLGAVVSAYAQRHLGGNRNE